MKAGGLRTTIIFEDFINTPNPDGSPNEAYTEVFRVKGKVIFLRGQAFYENYQYLHSVKGRAFIRYRDDIKNKYRIKIDGEEYEIDSVLPVDNKKRVLEIVFKAVEL